MHQGIEFCGGAGTLTLHAGGKLFARVAPYVARWSGACAHSLELPDHLELGAQAGLPHRPPDCRPVLPGRAVAPSIG